MNSWAALFVLAVVTASIIQIGQAADAEVKEYRNFEKRVLSVLGSGSDSNSDSDEGGSDGLLFGDIYGGGGGGGGGSEGFLFGDIYGSGGDDSDSDSDSGDCDLTDTEDLGEFVRCLLNGISPPLDGFLLRLILTVVEALLRILGIISPGLLTFVLRILLSSN